jgi:hypothetical protein
MMRRSKSALRHGANIDRILGEFRSLGTNLGMSANGQTFSRTCAQATSVSQAHFPDSNMNLRVGDVIGVQYGDRKSRCRVIWVMDGGPIQKVKVGVQIVTDQDCPWKSELKPDQITAPAEPNNRRRYARIAFRFP